MEDGASYAKILIVDDDPVNRKILDSLLKKQGYQTITADNGVQAVELFQSEQPDLILLDVIMPEMNGYDTAKKIKEISGDEFTPIIFLTSVTDEDALSKCVEIGGDDFLTKPFNGVILKAKISALQRIKDLYTTLNETKQSLEHYRSSVEHELEFAEHVLAKITDKAVVDLPYLKHWSSSMSPSDFSGDILFITRKPAGGWHMLLCDFSGHGLPAAVGALPVSEIFLAMTNRGFAMFDIMQEINKKLTTDLPTNFFCAAIFVDVDSSQSVLSIMNAGLPDCYLIDSQEGILHDVVSSQLPLGVVMDGITREGIKVFQIQEGAKLFMHTDGLSELMGEDCEFFGVDRIIKCINDNDDGSHIIDDIKQSVFDFCGDVPPGDDITAVELDCFAAMKDSSVVTRELPKSKSIPAEWKIEFELSIGVLKTINPVPLLVNAISNLQVSAEHRKRIFTIITELYANALDHGLLKLDSSLKDSPDGFIRYYQEKEARLNALQDGWAKIRVEHVLEGDSYALNVNVTDSGDGFDLGKYSETGSTLVENKTYSGRGLQLIRSLAHELEYQEGGRVACVKYYIKEDEQ